MCVRVVRMNHLDGSVSARIAVVGIHSLKKLLANLSRENHPLPQK
jgi:hypothetical protein